MSGKKTKLKKINLTSVDMVRRGANQEAYINLYKSAGDTGDLNPNQDALDPPNPNEIPQGLWKSIVEAVKGFLGKGEGVEGPKEEGVESPEGVKKAAESFQTRMNQQEIRDNRWKYQDALNMSIESIISDDSLTVEEKNSMAAKSVDEFATAYKDMCEKLITAADTRPKVATTEAVPMNLVGKSQEPVTGPDYQEEGENNMRIDKSRFTADELAQYEALIAKGKVEDEDPKKDPEVDPKKEEKPEVEKSAEMHPEVKKALEEMDALKKSMEMKEMADIAKKYAPLGKKEDELAATLYEMKKSSQVSYDAYLAVLDQNLDLVNKSGLFEEIGKSSRGIAGGSTVDKIESIATELQKSDATLGRHAAIAKAWEQHPELVAEYDAEYQR